MKYKSVLLKPYARSAANSLEVKAKNALKDQKRLFKNHIKSAKNTLFGKEHDFESIETIREYQRQVPLRSYEEFVPYIDRIKEGQKDILWPGKPRYFATTSGTTSGSKYIPMTKASSVTHVQAARIALFNYSHKWGDSGIWDGKMIFLSGSPLLDKSNGIPTGRLSGIVNLMIPSWIKSNQLPSFHTNSITDWELKVDTIVQETINEDMRVISGIPPWLIMYFEKILEATGKSTISDVFPNFSLLVHGGVNFNPYRNKMYQLIGKKVNTLETYPASEGFIAFEHHFGDGLLLNTFGGIFYEFVSTKEILNNHAQRLTLEDIEIGIEYAVILTTNAGLWSYILEDTVEFVSREPYLIEVTGRTKHFISAFGEHVIQKEVEQALALTIESFGASTNEFTVAPQLNTNTGSLPHHEWFIEFNRFPKSLQDFASELNHQICAQNPYYDDLIRGKIIEPLHVYPTPRGSFNNYMRGIGKLGGQNKIPHLSNDRKIADFLIKLLQ